VADRSGKVRDVWATRVAATAVKRIFAAVGLDIHRRRPAKPAASRPRDVHADLVSHVGGLLELQRVDCVLDVGAHVGEFGRLVRSAGWSGPILSFEPVSAAFRELEEAAASDPPWSVHRMALGREAGNLQINVMAGTNMSSFLQPTDIATGRWPDQVRIAAEETVELRRLDDILDELAGFSPQRLFLKLDTQGFDLEVLAGAAGVLDRIAVLQSEVSVRPIYEGMPTYLQALDTFQQCGFQLTGLYPVSRDREWRIIEYDAVLIRP
jgi:FkbM family methyltransferase